MPNCPTPTQPLDAPAACACLPSCLCRCLHDIFHFWPFLRPGGWLMGDDYHPTWPDVVQVANEFSKACELNLTVEGTKWVVRRPERMRSNLPDYCLKLYT